MKFFPTYRSTLTAIIIFAVIIPIFLLSIYVIYYAYDFTRTNATRELSLIAEKASDAVESDVRLLMARAAVLSADSDIQRGVKSVLFLERIDNLLKAFLDKNPLASAIILFDDEVNIVTVSPDRALTILNKKVPEALSNGVRDVVKGSSKKETIIGFSDVDLVRPSEYMFFLIFPITGLIGRVTGALVVCIPIESVLSFGREKVKAPTVFDIVSIKTGKKISSKEDFEPQEQINSDIKMINADVRLKLVSSISIPAPYFIRASEPEDVRFAAVRRNFTRLLIGSFLVIVFFGFLAFMISRRLVRPISAVSKHVASYAAGKYHENAPNVPFTEFRAVIDTLSDMGMSIEDNIKKLTEQERIKGELAKANIQAELDALRQQMNPHFLFNTLNSILTMISIDKDQAMTMITKLANLYRSVVDSSKTPTTTLAQELSIVTNYLDLEKVRFSKRLQYVVEAPKNSDAIFIPGLLLQNLVENAVKHGISKSRAGGDIRIKIEKDNAHYRCSITNTGGCGASGDSSMESTGGTSTGLANTRKRLDLLYGELHRFSISSTKSGDEIKTTVEFFFSGEKI